MLFSLTAPPFGALRLVPTARFVPGAPGPAIATRIAQSLVEILQSQSALMPICNSPLSPNESAVHALNPLGDLTVFYVCNPLAREDSVHRALSRMQDVAQAGYVGIALAFIRYLNNVDEEFTLPHPTPNC